MRVDGYGSGFGPPRVCRSGFWTVLELNRPVFAVQTRTAGGLPGPIADTKLDYGLQVRVQTRSITDSKCISEFNLISASKCISKLTLSRPTSASLSYSVTGSKFLSKLARSRSPRASLSYTITASRCISKHTLSRPPVHL